MDSKPKISIITVCYNAADVLEKTIQSVIAQTYDNLEYIIIDGKSQDGTDEILNQYRFSVAKIVSEPDEGLYDAMNKGISLASGEYINFMNAGDYFIDNHVIERVVKLSDESADVIYGDAVGITPDGHEIETIGGAELNRLQEAPIYRHNASFTRLSLHKKYPFDISKKEFSHALDYYHILSIYQARATFQHINLFVLKYECVGISDTPMKNVFLNFKINHQNPKIWDYLILLKKIFGVWKRRLLKTK